MSTPSSLTAGGPQNDGPAAKRWGAGFKYGHVFGVYVCQLPFRSLNKNKIRSA